MASTRIARQSRNGSGRRQQHVTPSLVKSETFLLGLFVLGLAIYVPYMLKTTGGKGNSIRYVVNTTTVPIVGTRDTFAIPSQAVVVPPTQVVMQQQPPAAAASVPVGQQQQQPLAGGAGGTIVPTEGRRRPAPITYIIPYLVSFARTVFGLISYIPFFLYRIVHAAVLRPLYYPLALILAVIRPITLLLEIIYAAFLHIPLSILSWIVKEAIYPLYLFSGMAAVIGTMFGYSASHIPRAAIFITERVRTQISKSQIGNLRPLLISPAFGYAGTSSSKKRDGGFSWRSAVFSSNNNSGENGTESDDTTASASRGRGLRGFVTRR